MMRPATFRVEPDREAGFEIGFRHNGAIVDQSSIEIRGNPSPWHEHSNRSSAGSGGREWSKPEGEADLKNKEREELPKRCGTVVVLCTGFMARAAQ
jgi:hypothetical protein